MTTTASGRFGPYALLLLRVVIGVVFVLHGYPKFGALAGVAGWFGSMGIPAPGFFAVVVAVVETAGGVLMILGALTRYAGVLLAIDMLVATVLVKSKIGMVAPMDKPGPPGAELDLTLLAGALVIAAVGPGAMALARSRARR